MVQIAGQLSFNDILADAIPMGFVDETKVGKVIPFQELKNYKDKKVIYEAFYGSGDDAKSYYRVVLIKDYYDKADPYFRNEVDDTICNDFIRSLSSEETKKHLVPAFVCDRIAYSDDNRTGKANSWLSEVYCSTGRHQICHNSSKVCFHELKAM